MKRFVLSLAALAGLAAAQTIVVNEAYTGTPDWIEIINLGPCAQNMGGYKVYWGCDSSGSFQSGFVTLPGTLTLAPGQVAVITDSNPPTLPAVPGGVFIIYVGANILWANANGTGGNGVATVVDPSGAGVDTLRWGNPTQTLNFGSPWSGTAPLLNLGFIRQGNIDTNSALNWVNQSGSLPLTAGAINVGQSPLSSMPLTLSTAGGGQFTFALSTLCPPSPFGEIFNLISLVDTVPDGSGPFFGLATDVLPEALTAADAFNPFHTYLDANGQYVLAVPSGILPVGLHFECVSLLVAAPFISRVSTLATITL